jgi:hypothetical protein
MHERSLLSTPLIVMSAYMYTTLQSKKLRNGQQHRLQPSALMQLRSKQKDKLKQQQH